MKKDQRRVPMRCDCGRASVRAGEDCVGSLAVNQCHRCRRLESEGMSTRRVMSGRLPQDERWSASISAACDQFFKDRGISNQ